ncbi:PH domain-containing protein [Oscillochloris sp. ZM17-4]|uniref:tetratricopeptide repeat protein n=1 Tax=Oscillochloris sp. ZM17-4 TaxID=2866714 RepID=UPI001C73737B|nr:PH domain-containing protein [Oscillochloris sp. ZM17-4]MBX0331532.1 PH domain-containing protein [Oscillochloris sp. ZM17-4]
MLTDDELKQHLKSLKVSSLIIPTAIKSGIHYLLVDQEAIEHLAQVTLNNSIGVLTVTDSRVLFVLEKKEATILSFSEITSIDYSANWLYGEMKVHSIKGIFIFTSIIDNDKGKTLFIHLKSKIDNNKQPLGDTSNLALDKNIDELVNQGIEALRNGDKENAQRLLMEAIRLDNRHEKAWLWLSGAVPSDDERRKCLEMVLIINSQNQAAVKGLGLLPPAPPVPPESQISAYLNNTQVINETPVSTVNNPMKTEYCRYCGKSIIVDSKFCCHCGQILSPITLAQPSISRQDSITSSPSPIVQKSTSEECTVVEATTHITRKGPSDWVGAKKLIITNKRVIWKSGVLDKTEVSILISKVQDVTVKYSLVGRTMGYGTLHIIASGAAEIIAEDIADAESVKSAILKQIS